MQGLEFPPESPPEPVVNTEQSIPVPVPEQQTSAILICNSCGTVISYSSSCSFCGQKMDSSPSTKNECNNSKKKGFWGKFIENTKPKTSTRPLIDGEKIAGGCCLGCLAIPIGILLLVVIGSFFDTTDNSPEAIQRKKDRDVNIAVRIKAEKIVLAHLTYPNDAVFGDSQEVKEKDLRATREYLVTGEVTTKNAFGGTFKKKYYVTLTYNKETDGYLVKDCQIN